MRRLIKIMGGGISGLTCAIHLRRAGFHVEVHERKASCGKSTDDFQFLENWCFREDVLDFLKRIRIRADFRMKPWFCQEFLSPSLKRYVGRSSRPLMYLVKRGESGDSLDRSLEMQAEESGVKVCYRSKLKREEADIVANGRRTPTFVASGVKFRCQNPDRSIVLFDNSLSEQFYSYLVVNDHVGEIACVNPVGCRHVQQRLRQTIRRFESVLHMEIHEVERRFSSVVSFGFPRRAGPVHPLEVGEAAGFQDHLAGFGMVYAFRSGYDAAKSIAEHLDYDRLWKKDFSRQLWISSMNRKVYGRLSNRHFEGLIRLLASRNAAVRALRGGDDLRLILKKAYTWKREPFGIP